MSDVKRYDLQGCSTDYCNAHVYEAPDGDLVWRDDYAAAAARAEAAEAKLARVGAILSENGCDCECDHHRDERGDDCPELCLACCINDALMGNEDDAILNRKPAP